MSTVGVGLTRGCAQARERPERDGVVAAEDERDRALGDDVGDDAGETRARLEDLGEEPRVLVRDGERLGFRRRHVATVDDPAAER